MIHRIVRFHLWTALALLGPAVSRAEPGGDGDWCEWLGGRPGTFHRQPENPWVQEAGIFGRLHWQAAEVDGSDINGEDFGEGVLDLRRLRFGGYVAFAQVLRLRVDANFVDDQRSEGGELRLGFQDLDAALLSFDAKKAFGIDALDSLRIDYGRFNFVIGSEVRTSSNLLLTVERSAIANKVFGGYRPTGIGFAATKGRWEVEGALFSTDANAGGFNRNTEGLAAWNDGLAYFGSVAYRADERLRFRWDLLWNDADRGEDSLWRYGWATVFTTGYDLDRWGVTTDLYLGDNGDESNEVPDPDEQGLFWGVVVLPYFWLVENRVQLVARYQYGGSEQSSGVRVNSRYDRDIGGLVEAPINEGRGNRHHATYLGANFHLCGDNLKILTGIERDWMNAPGAGTEGDFSSMTYWIAFRTFF